MGGNNPAAVLDALRARFGRVPLTLGQPVVDEGIPPSRTSLPPDLARALLIERGVVELAGLPGSGATTLALSCMTEIWARLAPAREPWLCAVDGSARLFAPALLSLGVPLHRLFVVAPPLAALPRVAVRVMKSGAFCAVLVDAREHQAPETLPVRRFTLLAEASSMTVYLLTSPTARRRAPLPTTVRVRVTPRSQKEIGVVIEHHRGGPRAPFSWRRPASPLERFFEEESVS